MTDCGAKKIEPDYTGQDADFSERLSRVATPLILIDVDLVLAVHKLASFQANKPAYRLETEILLTLAAAITNLRLHFEPVNVQNAG